ncbi:MAG TPA: response regulator [Gemmatimonadales bacterium]
MSSRILIVEDSRTQAEALRAVLEGAGYDVIHAPDAEQGLAIMDQQPPDVVISDVVMPGAIDGYELCRRIKSGPRSETPVMLLTALTDPMDIIRGLECGADNFLTKPYDPEHLLERLAVVIATRAARRERRVHTGVQIVFMGREFNISSEREQILDLLVTTFEEAVRQNRQLRQREEELTIAQTQIARYARSLEARIETILNSVPDVLFSVSADGAEVRYVSQAAELVFGCTPETFSIDYWRRHVHPADHEAAWESFQRAVSTRTAQALEYRFLPRAGDERWIFHHLVPAGNGKPRIDGIARDITDRKRVEEALRAAESRLQHVVAATPAVIYLLKVDGRNLRPTWVNDNITRVLGYNVQEALAPAWWIDNTHPDDRDTEVANRRKLLTRGSLTSEYRLRHKNGGYRWMLNEERLLRDEHGNPREVVGAWLDITERKSLETQLMRAQKMEVVGQLAGGLAHDFNNLLTVILASAQALSESLGKEHPLQPDADIIERAALDAASLTRQLLTLGRRSATQPKVLDINEVVKGMDRLLRRVVREDVTLRTVPCSNPAMVRADAGQLEQVITNLVINASDAMPEGGQITIETASVEINEAFTAGHLAADAGPHIMLAISDTGTGMDAETQTHLFEPFFTTKQPGKGTGLGLATVYSIVKQSGGHVWVYSEVGHGTTVKVYLPQTTPSQEQIENSAKPSASTHGTETVLLAEDQESVRRAVSRILADRGYTVLAAASGEEALRMAEARDEAPQLLITDMIMPGMTGVELARRLRERVPSIKVVYMSGYTGEAISGRETLNPGDSLVQKPFTVDSLARAVRAALGTPA